MDKCCNGLIENIALLQVQFKFLQQVLNPLTIKEADSTNPSGQADQIVSKLSKDSAEISQSPITASLNQFQQSMVDHRNNILDVCKAYQLHVEEDMQSAFELGLKDISWKPENEEVILSEREEPEDEEQDEI